jgi:hypothetical protein
MSKLRKEDLFDSGLFDDVNKGADALIARIESLRSGLEANLKVQRDFISEWKGTDYKALESLLKALKDIESTQIGLLKVGQQLEKVKAEEAKTQQQRIKNTEQEEKLRQQKIKTQQLETKITQQAAREAEKEAKAKAKAIKEAERQNSAYQQGVKRLGELKRQLKELEFAGRTNGKVYKGLREEFDALDKKVRGAEESVKEFQRNVGNYSNSLKEALSQTGLFNNGIGRLVTQLKRLRKEQIEAAKQNGKFGASLKLLAAGLIAVAIAAVVGIKKAIDASKEFGQSMQELSDKIDVYNVITGKGLSIATAVATAKMQGFKVSLKEALDAQADLIKSTNQYRLALSDLSDQLVLIELQEEDLKEISADGTIGFRERNKALSDLLETTRKRAEKEVEIAKLNKRQIEDEVRSAEKVAGAGNASVELKLKLSDVTNELIKAEDALGDLTRKNATTLRQRALDEAKAAIELTRSKKLSANSQAVILEKQLQDEKNQLEERRQIADKLFQVQAANTKEEIKIFKQKTGIYFDENKLLNEQDAIKLKNHLENIKQINEEGKAIGLGQEAIETLAKIVNKYQKDRLANADNIAKLDEEEIKRTQRLMQIQREITLMKEQDRVADQEILLNQTAEKYSELTEKIFEGENVFNRKISQQREIAYQIQVSNAIELFELKDQLLEAEAEANRKNIEDTINDEKIKAAEILKINEKLKIDKDNLLIDQQLKEKELNKKKVEDERKIRNEQIKIISDYIDRSLDAIGDGLQKRNDKINEVFDREIDARGKSLEIQQRLAEKGLNNQLAFEKKKSAELELQRREELERQRKQEEAIQLSQAYLSAFNSRLSNKEEPTQAAMNALRDVVLAKTLSKVVAGAFAEGVENFKGKGTGTSDSNLIWFSNGESVATARATAENPGLVSAMNDGKVSEYFEKVYLPQNAMNLSLPGGFAQNISGSAALIGAVRTEMRRVERAIIEKPVSSTNIDNLGNIIVETVSRGVKKVVVHKRPRI